MKRIAIVGGGLSGALVVVRLLREARQPLRLEWLERTAPHGRGAAYRTEDDSHLLNVRAGNMSAFPEEPDGFLSYLRATDPERADPDLFAPRSRYAGYLAHLLAEAEQHAAADVVLERIDDEAIAIEPGEGGATLRLASGRTLEADQVVLALGNLPPADPPTATVALLRSPRYVHDPWHPDSALPVDQDEDVLILGTSLTAVDVALSAARRGRRGATHLLSRRGLLPRTHAADHSAVPALELPSSARLTEIVKAVRRSARAIGSVDAARPLAARIWSDLSGDDRRRFLRHVRPYWDAHRHRIAPQVAADLKSLEDAGRLRVYAGRITGWRVSQDQIEVRANARRTRRPFSVAAARVVNCTGPATDLPRTTDPLVRQLLGTGLARPDPLVLGLDATPDGVILDARGVPSPVLRTLGPPLRGILWETTAVPEIRQQAAALARSILA